MNHMSVGANARRWWLMMLYCAAPLAAVAALLAFGIPVSQVLLWALMAACLLMHLFHGHGGGRHASHSDVERADGEDTHGRPPSRPSCH